MAITYGTILIIVLIPILVIKQFSEQNSGTIWLRSLKFEALNEEADGVKKKNYYPTFLNVFIQVGYKFHSRTKTKTKKKTLNYTLSPISNDFIFKKNGMTHFAAVREKEGESKRFDVKALFKKNETSEYWNYDFHDCFQSEVQFDEIIKIYQRKENIYFFFKLEKDYFLKIYSDFECNKKVENFEYKIPSDVNFEKDLFVQNSVLVYRRIEREERLQFFDL